MVEHLQICDDSPFNAITYIVFIRLQLQDKIFRNSVILQGVECFDMSDVMGGQPKLEKQEQNADWNGPF